MKKIKEMKKYDKMKIMNKKEKVLAEHLFSACMYTTVNKKMEKKKK